MENEIGLISFCLHILGNFYIYILCLANVSCMTVSLLLLFQISDEKREAYEDLAMNIFMKYSPKDSRSNRAECTSCETMIPDW